MRRPTAAKGEGLLLREQACWPHRSAAARRTPQWGRGYVGGQRQATGPQLRRGEHGGEGHRGSKGGQRAPSVSAPDGGAGTARGGPAAREGMDGGVKQGRLKAKLAESAERTMHTMSCGDERKARHARTLAVGRPGCATPTRTPLASAPHRMGMSDTCSEANTYVIGSRGRAPKLGVLVGTFWGGLRPRPAWPRPRAKCPSRRESRQRRVTVRAPPPVPPDAPQRLY